MVWPSKDILFTGAIYNPVTKYFYLEPQSRVFPYQRGLQVKYPSQICFLFSSKNP